MVRYIFNKNFSKIECSGKKQNLERGVGLNDGTSLFCHLKQSKLSIMVVCEQIEYFVK
jgi:hypothetical protein